MVAIPPGGESSPRSTQGISQAQTYREYGFDSIINNMRAMRCLSLVEKSGLPTFRDFTPTITRSEGQIRLSEDDGPPAHDFLEDEHLDRHDALELDEGDVRDLPERISPTSSPNPDYPPDIAAGIWSDGNGGGDERELQDLHEHRHYGEQEETHTDRQ
ncbi:hypothetical protein D9758_006552 [Tetrapyrgos nigripes]|uniref:Uncharacterized protein n=1 Tax=Tetrapyrgos nigripes TaxID=182062 RepID=A0A8H5GKM8_9AGAR|nr:hypothetical protein D9758_006552 [Tetrapyrgos nigripes]